VQQDATSNISGGYLYDVIISIQNGLKQADFIATYLLIFFRMNHYEGPKKVKSN
jgi:hypothetical protein